MVRQAHDSGIAIYQFALWGFVLVLCVLAILLCIDAFVIQSRID